MKKTVEVSLLEHRLTIKSDFDERYVAGVAKFVEDKIRQIQAASKSVSSLNIALLACLNIAGEYLCYRDDKKTKGTKAVKKIKDLVELIDKQL